MSLDSILRATGKNLFDINSVTGFVNSSGNMMSENNIKIQNGSIIANYGMYGQSCMTKEYVYLPAGTYTISVDVLIDNANANPVYIGLYELHEKINLNKVTTIPLNQTTRVSATVNVVKNGNYHILTQGAGKAAQYTNLNAVFSNIQLEKGSTATTYEPYEYLGPKSINLGSGSSGKEVLKVSYNSRNLLPYPWTTTTKTKHGITFTDNGDGSLTISGTATAETYFILQSGRDYGNQPINAIATESATNGKYAVSKRLYYNNNSKVISVNILNGATINETIYPQIELGNKATDYVPYFNTVVWEKQEIVATNKLGSFKLGESVLA